MWMHRLMLATNIVKKPHVTDILVDNELIVMSETSQTYFSLNIIGAKIWALLNVGSVCMIDLVQFLQNEYHLDEQQSIQDAQQFVELLLASDLVYLSDFGSGQNGI